jgi:hypothetical protein
MTKIKFAKIISIFILLLPFSGHTLEVEEKEILLRPQAPRLEHIFLEKETIVAFFEVTDIDGYKKLIPNVFSMPERPVCRVEVINFNKMESAPPYLEAAVAILIKFKKPKSGEEIHAWHFLAITVTSEEALWGRLGGFPKVLRKVTLESHANKYVGISYARDGNTPTLKLTFELKKGRPTRDEKRFFDFISSTPALTILRDRKVINRGVGSGGGKYKIYELQRAEPQIWKTKFGDCSIEYPNDTNNYLARLGIGKFITGYWLKQKVRFKIPYKEE